MLHEFASISRRFHNPCQAERKNSKADGRDRENLNIDHFETIDSFISVYFDGGGDGGSSGSLLETDRSKFSLLSCRAFRCERQISIEAIEEPSVGAAGRDTSPAATEVRVSDVVAGTATRGSHAGDAFKPLCIALARNRKIL